MTEVKLTYYPMRCAFGGDICDSMVSCADFSQSDDDFSFCRWASIDNNPCIYHKSVKSVEWEGFDAYSGFYLKIGNKVFSDRNCDIGRLEIDGTVVYDTKE